MLVLKIRVDFHAGSGAFVFKLLKPRIAPPLEQLRVCDEFAMRRVRLVGKSEPVYSLRPFGKFNPSLPVEYDSKQCYLKVVDQQIGTVTVNSDADTPGLAKQFQDDFRTRDELVVTQAHVIVDPGEVASHVHDYWAQYWLREDGDVQMFPDYDQAIALLDRVIPPMPSAPEALSWEHMKEICRRMKSFAARGADGFASGDLQKLPNRAWEHLFKLLQACLRKLKRM